MKYLNYFESKKQFESLAKDYLANLMDNGISLNIAEDFYDSGKYLIELQGNFKIDDIKDDLYQFINIMRQHDYIPCDTPYMTFKNGNYNNFGAMATRNISLGELLSRKKTILMYYNIVKVGIHMKKFKRK